MLGGGVWGAVIHHLLTDPPTLSSADLWHRLAELVDPARDRPTVAPYVEVKHFAMPWDNSYAMAANRRDLVYYRLEPGEAELLPLMDGTRSVGELVVEHLRRSGDLEAAGVVELVHALAVGNFFTEPYVDSSAALSRALEPKAPWRVKLSGFVKTLSIEWAGAERLVRWLYMRFLRVLFTRIGEVATALVALAGLVAFIATVASHRFHLTVQSVGLGFVVLMVLNIAIVFIHELGHAALLVHHGRRVKSAGFRIYFGAPSFFIDSSDSLMLERGPRIAVSFAGPYFELVAAGIAALVLWTLPSASLAPTLYRFVVLNYFVLVLNLMPLLELDGYWILSDAIQLPELRSRSLAFIRSGLWHKLARRERWSISEAGLGLYGTLGVIFTVACLYASYFFWRRTFGDVISKMWEAGLLGRVLLGVLVLFLTGPVLRAGLDLVRALFRALRDGVQRARFRTQRHWRVDAAHLIDAQPVFDDLPIDVLNELAGRVRLRRVRPGTEVVREGGRADAYYVVRSGTLQVSEDDPRRGVHRTLRTLRTGDGFGELGLATGAPRKATVRAVTSSDLVVVEKGTFERFLLEYIHLPAMAPTLQALAEVRALPPFTHLGGPELRRVLEHGSWQRVVPHEAVVTQGEAGDAFYAVESGRLEVIEDGLVVGEVAPDEHFGELALLLDQPRIATVRALTPCRVFRLGRPGFDALLKDAFRGGRIKPNVALNRSWDH